MIGFLFIIVALLIFLLVFLVVRRWKARVRLQSIGFEAAGAGIILLAAGIWTGIECSSSPNPFCGVGLIVFSPVLLLGGLTIGFVVGHVWSRTRKKENIAKPKSKSLGKGYVYALLGSAWFTLLYAFFSSDAEKTGYNVIVAWEAAGALSLLAFLFLAWFLQRKKNQTN